MNPWTDWKEPRHGGTSEALFIGPMHRALQALFG